MPVPLSDNISKNMVCAVHSKLNVTTMAMNALVNRLHSIHDFTVVNSAGQMRLRGANYNPVMAVCGLCKTSARLKLGLVGVSHEGDRMSTTPWKTGKTEKFFYQ
jgi:hypothetical protein